MAVRFYTVNFTPASSDTRLYLVRFRLRLRRPVPTARRDAGVLRVDTKIRIDKSTDLRAVSQTRTALPRHVSYLRERARVYFFGTRSSVVRVADTDIIGRVRNRKKT